MTDDPSNSVELMRDVVRRLRTHDNLNPVERDTLAAILEEQIAEMERERAGAWS